MNVPLLRNTLYTLIILFAISVSGKSNHIIGGDMYYDCLGFLNNDPTTNTMVFRITMELYRDCQARNAAFFDNPAGVTIFRGNDSPYDFIDNIPVRYIGPDDIDPPTFPCLNIPSNVCVHKARYEFEVELELSAQSYHIVWQRCCRNESINNIFFPGDVGATFTVEITPLAQQRCNNSPRFDNFPPTVICGGEPLAFDHGATDPEGDNLVYEFCAPLIGGGLDFGGGGCTTPNPNPDCPPPFETVTFRSPQYTSSFPLGGNPRVTIDQITGEITGVPLDLGQFVVGVCVREFRNGTLLSTIRRDFQFNVSTCSSNFTTSLDATAQNPDGDYVFTLCNELSTRILNRSTGIIDSVAWIIDLGDSIIRTNQWSPDITFEKGGRFDGLYIINPNTPCSDSAILKFEVVEDLTANFSATYDTCISGPVQYVDQSTSSSSSISAYDWDLDERKTDTSVNPRIEYEDPGDYNIQLIVTDDVGCMDTTTKSITYKPAPEVIIIRPSVKEGCVPLTVGFENLSFPVDSTYQIDWFFSDGDIASGFSPTKVFTDTGLYSIRLEVTSPIGCFNDQDFTDVVRVFPEPIAGYQASAYELEEIDPTVLLTDTSAYNQGREWWFNGTDVRFDTILTYTFPDTGIQRVTLYAVDRFGCVDTISKVFDVRPFTSVFFPNAFTPNNDGNNEAFLPVGEMDYLRQFQMDIYNRWGEAVFSSADPNLGWNGQVNNTGNDCPNGVYVMKLKYTLPRGEVVEESKNITLLR